MITTIPPTDWRDLQNQVYRILAECGFKVETELVIENARGSAEIDVYAEEVINGRKYSIICECKNWQTNIPQNTIHGFRSLVGDIGANLGIIITTSDYQSGAHEASKFTNIQLLTWEHFQSEFEKQWLETHFHPTITEKFDPLFTYSEPLAPAWYPKLTLEDKKTFHQLHQRYAMFRIFMQSLSQWGRPFSKELVLPLGEDLIKEYRLYNLPNGILMARGYRDFLNLCLEHGGQAISEFRVIRNKYYSLPEEAED